MDKIFIRELRAPAWIGIYEWEQRQPQTLEFDIDVGVATSRAGASDRIDDTVDYGKVVEHIRGDLATRKFNLLEALAEHVAQILLQDFGALQVRVSVAKIAHMRDVRRVGVVIERERRAVGGGAGHPSLPPGFADSALG